MYDDDETPKLFEKHLTEVFPKVAPGNFTFNKEISKYIMTTFYPFQWDLNYTNPYVFNEMVENLLFLANVGVDMIRLDAIPFIWKLQGTDSRNLSEVHDILFLFREIIESVAPSTALLGEAIVQPDTIIKYFGSTERPECHVLYNASYMVEIWNALATRDARHIAQMTSYEIPVESLWINYARCHDDIGWGLESDRIRQLGFDPHAHKMYLIDFYLGILKNSFSVGELYEFNPQTLDARNSGTLASLAGLEKAVAQKDHYQLELALKRIELIHAMFILRKGIPMLYSGDEWGALNNYAYKLDAEKAHDSRWVHRTKMDWDVVETLSHQSINILDHPPLDRRSEVFNRIVSIIRLRKKVYEKKHVWSEVAIQLSNPHILAIKQDVEGNDASILLLFNLSEDRQWIYTSELKRQNIQGIRTEYSQGKVITFEEETILMGPYEYLVV
jgi:amylosucrase